MPDKPAVSGFSELDGFTNPETRAFYQWISRDPALDTDDDSSEGLTGLREVLRKASSPEDLGNRLLDWFMCFLHEQPGSNIFYNTVVEKAIVSVHWNEIGERLFSEPGPEAGGDSPTPDGDTLTGPERAFLDWVLAEKRDTLAGLVTGGADAVEIMEMLEGTLDRIRIENGFVARLLESARRDIRLSLITARIFDFFR